MRVHSSLSPRYNHFAALSGRGFDNIQAYKGKGGALFNLSDRRRKAIKAAAIAAAMAAAAAAGAHHLNKRAAGKNAGPAPNDDEDWDWAVIDSIKDPVQRAKMQQMWAELDD